MTRLLRLYGTICVAVLSGCGGPVTDPSPPVGDVSVVTDKTEYSLTTDSVAVITLLNRSNQAVHLPMGEYLAYERLVGGEWVDGYAWFTADGIGRSFPLPALSSRQDQLEIWAYLAGQPGTYRFQYFIYLNPSLRFRLPLESRVSEPFVVTP